MKHSNRHNYQRRGGAQAGFSILELLISLMLGLVIIAGIVQLFSGNSRTYQIVNAQARLQESARYSFEFITSAAQTAGFYGCAPEAEYIANGLNGAWAVIPEYNLTEPVNGFESNGDGTYAPNDLLTLPRSEGGANLNVHINGNGIDRTLLEPGSDLLIFRTVEQPYARLDQTLQPTADPVVFTPGGEPDFNVNDVVLVADCEQAGMFTVTGVVDGADTQTLARAENPGGGPFANSDQVITLDGDVLAATLSILSRSYGEAATLGRVQSTIFFISPSVDANEAGVNINALWRKQGNEEPVELVQGVENMQIFYGVDLSNDDVVNVNQYQTIDNVVDLASIVTVRIRLDISSPDQIAGQNDRLRRTYSKTINMRNSGV